MYPNFPEIMKFECEALRTAFVSAMGAERAELEAKFSRCYLTIAPDEIKVPASILRNMSEVEARRCDRDERFVRFEREINWLDALERIGVEKAFEIDDTNWTESDSVYEVVRQLEGMLMKSGITVEKEGQCFVLVLVHAEGDVRRDVEVLLEREGSWDSLRHDLAEGSTKLFFVRAEHIDLTR